MRCREPRRGGAWPGFATLLLCVGCAGPGRPPAITIGTPCFACGMEVRDLRFACERKSGGGWRAYDAIECLLRDAASAAAPGTGDTWLADYDTRALYPADSAWVVQGAFASPMGGGLAAFRGRAAADSIASRTSGRVERLATFMAAAGGRAP